MYGLFGTLSALEGKGEALSDILRQASVLVKKYGCHQYTVCSDLDDADTLYVFEVWKDKEAHASSLQIDEVRSLIMQGVLLLREMPKGGTSFVVEDL